MEAQRAMLDSLMGFNRDGDRPDDDPQLDFRHPRVCKPFLCGLCPRELFQNTRLDAGACQLIHSPSIRAAYEQEATRDFGYERALATELSRLLADVERKIAKAQRRLDEDNGDTCPDRARLLELTQELQNAAAQAAQRARDGDADASLQLVEKAELLKRKRRELLRQTQTKDAKDGGAPDVIDQKLRVCDVCGAFLSIFDSERRLADHFGGKVHVGYVQIRRKLKELVEKTQQQKQEKEKEQKEKKKQERRRRSVSRSVSRSRSRRRDERPRSRRDDRDRERRRDRERPRSRERRRRSRDRHRRRRSESSSRSRSRSRDRDRDRDRKRHRSRRR